MAHLSDNWIIEKVIDFEYKKYILLAYLKEVSEQFELNMLYPRLSELFNHYRQATSIRENKQNLLNAFPQRLQKMDMESFRIEYEKIIQDDALMSEIENILEFSIPQFEHYISEGKKIYDFIEEQLHVFPVGVMPLNPEQGYMLLKDGKKADTRVYEYQITIFNQPDEKYRAIHTTFVNTYRHSLVNTFESIKNQLLREYKKLPNPATFVIESGLEVPMDETFLPIAKRVLVKFVGSQG